MTVDARVEFDSEPNNSTLRNYPTFLLWLWLPPSLKPAPGARPNRAPALDYWWPVSITSLVDELEVES
jgi:hypothetical protein